MSRHRGITTAVIVMVIIAAGGAATAATPMHGRVQGMVCDASGRGLADASVLAVGQTIVSVRSDLAGRYSLLLPPGDYVLRASRDGYVSMYREPVRIQGSALLERTITLVPQGASVTDPKHSHTETAWRLRHLPRGVLRDGNDWTRNPARTTAGPLIDLSGQINLLTTGEATMPAAWDPANLPRGVAFVEFGAPVIGHGSWTLRAALASGAGRTWNVFGEYESEARQLHAWKMRVSYSTQGFTRAAPEGGALSTPDIRSVAGIAGEDRWQIAPAMEVTYGGRAERFDYLVRPHLVSAHAGFSAEVLPMTLVRVRMAQNMIAPGADEFLPPPTGGAWLPAERMFEPLSTRRALRAERLRAADVSLTHRLRDDGRWPTIHVRAFRQQTDDQMATLFGTDADPTGPGPYFIAPVGAVTVMGLGVGASAQFSPNISGQFEYTRVTSEWDQDPRVRAVRRLSPSVLRTTEDLHDITATLDATVPRSATRISVAYRTSTGFSGQRFEPGLAGRFHLQVHQALPFKPTRTSQVELMFSLRNLFRDITGDASWYDELLTVSPPLRFVGGLQIRF